MTGTTFASPPPTPSPRSLAPTTGVTLPLVGQVVDGKYRIDSYIGTGSMGAVARAKHLARDADVALKFLTARSVSSEDKVADRFRLEAIAASRLHTDHVVRVFDVAESREGLPYLVMELLDGEDLDRLLMRDGAMPIPRAIHLVLQALRALDVAHAAGVVHRDLKPGNLFVLPRDGDPDFVKIVDFGISKVEDGTNASPRLTQGEMAMGTPLYMAPEQASDAGSVTGTADVYSAAAVLYECIAGTPPLVADRSIELLFKLMQVTPARLDALVPAVPPGLADAVAQALSKKPTDRPASAAAFAELLAPYADERSTRALVALRLVPRPSSSSSLALPDALADGGASLAPLSPRVAGAFSRRSSPELDALLLRRPTPGRGVPARALGEITPNRASRAEISSHEAVDLRRLVGDMGDLPALPSGRPPPREEPSSRPPAPSASPPSRGPRSKQPAKPTTGSWLAVALLSFAVVFLIGLAILQLTGVFRASARHIAPREGRPALASVSVRSVSTTI
jgi:serine/threonine-protein kinase